MYFKVTETLLNNIYFQQSQISNYVFNSRKYGNQY